MSVLESRSNCTRPSSTFIELYYSTLKRYKGLCKYESTLLTQARIGKIRLQAFLFERRVLDITTLLYYCRIVPETATHLILDYLELQGACRVLQLQ